MAVKEKTKYWKNHLLLLLLMIIDDLLRLLKYANITNFTKLKLKYFKN